MRKASYFIGVCTGIVLCNTFLGTGCNHPSPDTDRPVAQKYCGSCHVFPDPQLLPRDIWESRILPAMGVFADFYRDRKGEYRHMTESMIAAKDPVARNISFRVGLPEWGRIVQFYLQNAPEQLPEHEMQKDTALSTFDVLVPPKMRRSFTSSIYVDKRQKEIFEGSITSDSMLVFNDKLQYIRSISSANGIVDVSDVGQDTGSRKFLFTHIGSLRPEPPPLDRSGYVEVAGMDLPLSREMIADSLNRPVKSLLTDVNRDGLKDLVVCQFGFLQGELSLFLNNGKGYTKKVLSSLPGAVDIKQDDINGDGLPDLWVLFAAAYEGIVQFINKGNGAFEQHQVLSFPPCYGSTSFQLVDINKDGRKDIVYTCGDNADYSQVLKPYHGIYVYMNTGPSFKREFFFPMNGCYKAVVEDYDMDGDMDIAAIAFFADYEKYPEEGFVYFENRGDNKFQLHTFPLAKAGRWVCMECVDYDGDGDTDILLGNLAAKPRDRRDLMLQWIDGPEFIALRNKTK